MKTSSAKAKGRNLQKKVRELLIEHLNVDPEDIESRSMGAGGEDLIMAKAARNLFLPKSASKNELTGFALHVPLRFVFSST